MILTMTWLPGHRRHRALKYQNASRVYRRAASPYTLVRRSHCRRLQSVQICRQVPATRESRGGHLEQNGQETDTIGAEDDCKYLQSVQVDFVQRTVDVRRALSHGGWRNWSGTSESGQASEGMTRAAGAGGLVGRSKVAGKPTSTEE